LKKWVFDGLAHMDLERVATLLPVDLKEHGPQIQLSGIMDILIFYLAMNGSKQQPQLEL